MRGAEVGVVAIGRHGDVPSRLGRAYRGLHGDRLTAGGPSLHRGALATAAGAQRRKAGGGYFVSRCKAGKSGPRESDPKSRRRKIAADAVVGPDRLPSDRPLEGRGAGPPGRAGSRSTGPRARSESLSRPGSVRRAQQAGHIFRGKLEAQGRAKMIDAKVAEVFIEIP